MVVFYIFYFTYIGRRSSVFKDQAMTDNVITNLIGELASARAGQTSLCVEDARKLCRTLQRYPNVDRGDAVRFLKLFDQPGQWLVINALFNPKFQLAQTNVDDATNFVVNSNIFPLSAGRGGELDSARNTLLAAHVFIHRRSDVVVAVSLLREAADAIENGFVAKTVEDLDALEREQYELCDRFLNLCGYAEDIARSPGLSHSAEVRDAMWVIPQLRGRIEGLRAALVPAMSAVAMISGGACSMAV